MGMAKGTLDALRLRNDVFRVTMRSPVRVDDAAPPIEEGGVG